MAMTDEPLRVAIPRAMPPFSFFDKESGRYRGVCVDLSRLLAARLDRKIRFAALDASDFEGALAGGRVDIVCGMPLQPLDEHESFHVLKTGISVERRLFVHRSCMTVVCIKDLTGKTVAIEKGRDRTRVLSRTESVRFVSAENHEAALALVNTGEAQAYISPSALTSLYLIQKNRFQNIKEIGLPIDSTPLSIAVRKGDAELLTNLSVAFGKIQESGRYDLVYRKWLGRTMQVSVWEGYVKYILMAFGVVAAAAFILVFWNRMLKKRVNKVTETLRHSEERYRELIESSPEMIHLVDRDGKVILCNRVATGQRGGWFLADERLHLADLVHQDQKEVMVSFLDHVFRSGHGERPFVFENESGTKMQTEMIASRIRGLEHGEDMVCCFSRDITERKRLEEELIQTEKLAIIGQMAAGIAHEINNPLGIILANAQDALFGGLDHEGIKESLSSIERNAERAGKIMEDLLSFTRPGTCTEVPIDLTPLIEESLSFLKPRLKKRRIQVKRDYSGDEMVLMGDENQIRQLIINLILNACEAVKDQGNICIHSCSHWNNGRKWVRVEIKDTGVGIPESELIKIFDPFFTRGKRKGFGLGLFISRRIVENHKGTISAESREGEGTKMIVELPALPQEGRREHPDWETIT